MRVVITDEAKADLVDIGEYIHPHNPARAVTFVDELLDRCATLAGKKSITRSSSLDVSRRITNQNALHNNH
jgi:plasmid stabilization system protein ParE